MWAPPSPTSETSTPVLPSFRFGMRAEVVEAGGSGVVPSLGAGAGGPLALHAATASVPPRNSLRLRSVAMVRRRAGLIPRARAPALGSRRRRGRGHGHRLLRRFVNGGAPIGSAALWPRRWTAGLLRTID